MKRKKLKLVSRKSLSGLSKTQARNLKALNRNKNNWKIFSIHLCLDCTRKILGLHKVDCLEECLEECQEAFLAGLLELADNQDLKLMKSIDLLIILFIINLLLLFIKIY